MDSLVFPSFQSGRVQLLCHGRRGSSAPQQKGVFACVTGLGGIDTLLGFLFLPPVCLVISRKACFLFLGVYSTNSRT